MNTPGIVSIKASAFVSLKMSSLARSIFVTFAALREQGSCESIKAETFVAICGASDSMVNLALIELASLKLMAIAPQGGYFVEGPRFETLVDLHPPQQVRPAGIPADARLAFDQTPILIKEKLSRDDIEGIYYELESQGWRNRNGVLVTSWQAHVKLVAAQISRYKSNYPDGKPKPGTKTSFEEQLLTHKKL